MIVFREQIYWESPRERWQTVGLAGRRFDEAIFVNKLTNSQQIDKFLTNSPHSSPLRIADLPSGNQAGGITFLQKIVPKS